MNLILDNEIAVDLWQIIAHYGYKHQKAKTIEELSELAEALSRNINGMQNRENIAEEMADVYIMLAQLMLIYGNRPEVARVVGEKIGRTLERVEAERKEEGQEEGRTLVKCIKTGGPYVKGHTYKARQGDNGVRISGLCVIESDEYVFHNYGNELRLSDERYRDENDRPVMRYMDDGGGEDGGTCSA